MCAVNFSIRFEIVHYTYILKVSRCKCRGYYLRQAGGVGGLNMHKKAMQQIFIAGCSNQKMFIAGCGGGQNRLWGYMAGVMERGRDQGNYNP